MRVLSAHKQSIRCVAFSPDGTQLAEISNKGVIHVWDVAAGAVKLKFIVRRIDPSNMRLAFAPKDNLLALMSGSVVFFDLANGGQRKPRREDCCTDLAFSPDGKQLACTTIYTYTRRDVATGKALPRLTMPPDLGMQQIYSWQACAFTRDGAKLALARYLGFYQRTWKYAQQVVIHDFAAKVTTAQMQWPGKLAVRRVAFSPNGKFLAAIAGAVLRVWNAHDGTPVVEKQLGKSPFTALAFSPDGRYLATVNKDTAVRMWEVGAWNEPKALEWNAGKLRDVIFSPDGTTAAASSDKGQIVLFDVD